MKTVNFLNCKIDVSRKVFIPRPETEFWVEKTIKEIKKIKNSSSAGLSLRILDIFAGSGCIGIAVLKACPELCQKVDFRDIDKKAIEAIKINIEKNNIPKAKYRIIKSNLFECLESEKYNIIFANPPYVALNRIAEVDKEVLKKEPKIALFAGPEGMTIIEKFLEEVKKHLKQNGVVYLEFDPLQKEKIKKILEEERFQFSFRRDQFQKYRWVKIKNI
jgi:release factor glutamine methyltransferase